MVNKTSFDKVRKEIRKMVAEIAEVAEKDLKDDANLSGDLGVDSMKALEIVATIEKKFKVRIPEQKIPTIRSVQNIYDLVEKGKKK